MVGQIPDATGEEAMAFFERRFDSLRTDVNLLKQRIQSGTISPDEARKAVPTLKTTILEANAVGDLEGLAAELDGLTGAIDEAAEKRREERAKAAEETRQRKEEMVGEAEKLAEGTDWRHGVTKFRELLEAWKALPRLDRASDDELWRRFSAARTTYTRRRKTHFAEVSDRQAAAAQAKEAIIAEAETLADSTDWGATAGQFRQLMDRWKAAGSAARATDEALWTRFRAIQDTFFNRRSEVFNQQEAEFQGNLEAKLALLDEAEKSILPVTDVATARSAYREFIGQFNALGRVPRSSMQAVDSRVRAIEAAIDEADRKEWARTDPETKARATGTVSLFSGQIAKLEADLAQAEAAGDAKKKASVEASLATYRSWLEQAEKTLSELG